MSYRLIYKCPHCGGRPRREYHGLMRLHMVTCCRMTGAKPTPKEAIEAWNALAETELWRRRSAEQQTAPTD